jgi:hypothetical protein
VLVREGISRLEDLIPKEEQVCKPVKTFKDYAPGFIHIDLKTLPQMPDETRQSYLCVAIDRASRWVYFEILPDKTAANTQGFIDRLVAKAAFKIEKILTDNGKEFTDRYTAQGEREPTGNHPFDQACHAHGIEHRLSPPYHPQTNGMVERFNGRIAELLKTTHFRSAKEFAITLGHYLRLYNGQIPQRALGHVCPIQALKNWYQKEPERFNFKIYNLARLDSLFSAHLIHRFIDDFEDMEFIKGDLGIGQFLFDFFDKRRRHIATNILYLHSFSTMINEEFSKVCHRTVIFTLGNKKGSLFSQIHKKADIVVPFFERCFINANRAYPF